MLEEIFRNMVGRKKVISFPDGFVGSDADAVKMAALHETIDMIFRRSLRIRQVDAGSFNDIKDKFIRHNKVLGKWNYVVDANGFT